MGLALADQSLHSLTTLNPYQSVLQILCKTLAAFDDDHMIPTFGFGDVCSRDTSLMSFHPQCRPLHTLEGVFAAYKAVMPHVSLSGPTSFAPAIYHAMSIVQQSGGGFHVLLIIADGQVRPQRGRRCLSAPALDDVWYFAHTWPRSLASSPTICMWPSCWNSCKSTRGVILVSMRGAGDARAVPCRNHQGHCGGQ